VMLAHHRRDQAETLLLQALRGAGAAGLAAMPTAAERDGIQWLRPWLEQPRSAIDAYVRRYRLSFVDDDSNADERFARNKLRARLMPALAEALPHYRQTLARSARHAAQAQALLDEVAAEDLRQAGSPPLISALQQLSVARQANVLRHWLASAHGARPSAAQLEELQRQLSACTTRGHRIELRLADGQLVREGQALAYRPCPEGRSL